jgi:biopolymer transport protein ExbB/TolQ
MEQIGTLAKIGEAFAGGGIWMYAILAVQIVSLAIIFERFMALYVARRPNQNRLSKNIESEIRRGNIDSAISEADRLGRFNPIGIVALAGLNSAKTLGGREEIQSKMDEILIEENNRLEKRTGFLTMLGNVGTLLGLLGTIVGLIQAFSAVSDQDAMVKAAMLTKGISLAMNTTAYGLIMAIPALIMFAVLQNRARILSDDLNQGALRLYNSLSFGMDIVNPRKSRQK